MRQDRQVGPNVSVPSGEIALTALPANSQILVTHVAEIRVNPSATGSQAIQIAVTVMAPNSPDARIVVNATTVPHIQSEIVKLDYDSKPKVGKSTELKVEVKNTSNVKPTAPMKVVITTQESSSDLRIDQGSSDLKAMDPGKKNTAKGLKYTVLSKEALARGLKIKVTVYHGRNVSSATEYVLRAN